MPADYDGDGKTDGAVFRPSEGNWYVLNSNNGTWIGLHFGLNGISHCCDYDGDGKADIAVYRRQTILYVLGTTRDSTASRSDWTRTSRARMRLFRNRWDKEEPPRQAKRLPPLLRKEGSLFERYAFSAGEPPALPVKEALIFIRASFIHKRINF